MWTSLTRYRLKVSESPSANQPDRSAALPPVEGAEVHGESEPTAPTETAVSVGELRVLDRIFPRLPRSSSELLGPGDDAAVVAAPDGRFVVTSDMMIQGPDFRLAWSAPYELGWKAAVTNLSDVAAMGARPTALVVAIAAPGHTSVADFEAIADGLRDACAELAPGCGVVGGDLSVADSLTFAVTAFGDLAGRAPVVRSGARPGDTVAVAGSLGLAGAGIWLLFRDGVGEPDASGNRIPDSSAGADVRREHPRLVREQLTPRSPIALGVVAAKHGATAMLDISDGLVLDASRIARASGVSLDFDGAAIAAEAEALRALDGVVAGHAVDFVLAGGEDHSLLATFPADVELPAGFRALGTVERSGEHAVTIAGEPYRRPGGWDPYADWNGSAG